MLAVGWVVAAVVVATLLTAWITFTATRMDRLHARIDAAQAALDAQLVRRAAAVQHVADSADGAVDAAFARRMSEAAQAALSAPPDARERTENAVGRVANDLADLREQLPPALAVALSEVADAALRVMLARRFYNDAVRDTRTLRTGRMPRLLHLAGHRELPQFFDIDDTTRWSTHSTPAGGTP